MASGKKRRKTASIDRRLKRPASARPRDGDRRHRGADLARLAQQLKEAEREWNLDVGWTDAPANPEPIDGNLTDRLPHKGSAFA